MRQDTAERLTGLGRLFASGASRIARQARLSRGQVAVLALCLFGAVTFGLLLQPRGSDQLRGSDGGKSEATQAAPEPSGEPEAGRGIERVDNAETGKVAAAEPLAPASPPEGQSRPSGAADTATVAALDRLASEIVKINKRIDEVVAGEKETRDRVAALGTADRPATLEARSRDVASREAPRAQPPTPVVTVGQRRIALTVRRAAVSALAMRRIALEQDARERAERRFRIERRARIARRRGFAGLRSVFGLPIRF